MLLSRGRRHNGSRLRMTAYTTRGVREVRAIGNYLSADPRMIVARRNVPVDVLSTVYIRAISSLLLLTVSTSVP